jgi:hypothetical protein
MFDTLEVLSDALPDAMSVGVPGVSLDGLEQGLLDRQAAINRLHAEQVALLGVLSAGQVHVVDGARSMIEWTSARLDVTHETAKLLIGAARCVPESPDLHETFGSGTMTIERAFETAKLAAAGADPATVAASAGLDMAGVRRLRARHRRMSRHDETTVFTERFWGLSSCLCKWVGWWWWS